MMTQQDSSLKAKLRWRCHRGMLELDMILIPYFEAHEAELDGQKGEDFLRLLREQDPDLWSWFMGFERFEEEPALQQLIDEIRQFHQQIT